MRLRVWLWLRWMLRLWRVEFRADLDLARCQAFGVKSSE